MVLGIIIALVAVALVFDFTNGFHDAANAIATSVSTRALTPRIALVVAAVMNIVGAFLGQAVAHTVSDTIVPSGSATHGLVIVMGGLLVPSAGICSPGTTGCRRRRHTHSSVAWSVRPSRRAAWCTGRCSGTRSSSRCCCRR